MSPTDPAAERREVRLHLKQLHPPPTMTPEAMVDCMRAVYAPHGIDVVFVPPVEDLGALGDVLKDLWVDACWLGNPTDEQNELFGQYRNGVPADEICLYFVRSTEDKAAGCASLADAPDFPHGRPAAVVTEDATAWTLAHECGHVLGLSHVLPIEHLMVSGTWSITANPPALDADEVTTIKSSPFTKPVSAPAAPPAPGCAPPPPQPDEAGGDATRSKGEGDDPVVDAIRSELDHDDGVDYERLAREFGPSAVEALALVARTSRPRIAAGAVDLAGRIEGGSGLPVVAQGAASEEPVVRVAAAASARRLPEEPASRIVERLLEDDDVGVRGHAVRSAVQIGTPDLLERVRVKAREDPSAALRELAERLLRPPGKSAS
jgi:hypothetical protein